MSEEQQKRPKVIERLIAYRKRWWKSLTGAILAFCFIAVTVGLIVIWDDDPELAKFAGYLIGGILLFWQILASNRRATAAEKTAELTERGNIAERFKNAIEHLGHKSASIRLGGIYALHHIAHEVEEYRERVFEILCAHIRETTTQETYTTEIRESEEQSTQSEREEPTIEIQSILNLLCVKTPGREIYEGLEANLEKANLAGARLREADLRRAYLQRANLQGAYLQGADLQGANLQRANLQRADLQKADLLQKANLQKANLQMAYLQEANLQWANLQGAYLQGAYLQGAYLQWANLEKADLQMANLQGAYLQWANLQGAYLQRADLQKADLQEADLQGAYLYKANLQGADLQKADLQKADLIEADLIEAKNLEVKQLLEAKTLYKAKLPEGMEEIIRQQNPKLLEKPSDE